MSIDGVDEWFTDPSSGEVFLADDSLIDGASFVIEVIILNSRDMLLGGSLLLFGVNAVVIIVEAE